MYTAILLSFPPNTAHSPHRKPAPENTPGQRSEAQKDGKTLYVQ